MDRLAQLEKFVAGRPDDPFPRYALALEHKSRGDLPKAVEALSALTERLPDYVPAYLILGQLHQQAGRDAQAREAWSRGQEKARAQGNQHALSELTSSLEQLG